MAKVNNIEKIAQKLAEGICLSITDVFKHTYQQYSKITLYAINYDELTVDPKSHKYYWQPIAYFKIEDPGNKVMSSKYMTKIWLDPLQGKPFDRYISYSSSAELAKIFHTIVKLVNVFVLEAFQKSYQYINFEQVKLLYFGSKAARIEGRSIYYDLDTKFSRFYLINEKAFYRCVSIMSRAGITPSLQYARVRIIDFDGFSLLKDNDIELFIAPETANSPAPNESDITGLIEMYEKESKYYGDSLKKSFSAFSSQIKWKKRKNESEIRVDEN